MALSDFVTVQGHLRFSIHALLVEAPGIRLVVDTCVGNDRPRGIPVGLADHGFLKSFADAGLTRDGVDAVLCTHLHVDHVGWNTMLVDGAWVPTFPKARYLIGRAEYEHWRAEEEGVEDVSTSYFHDCVKPIFDAGLVDLVEIDHRVSDEISLEPTLGHTPGHVSIRIRSAGRGGADHRRLHPPPLPVRPSRVGSGLRRRSAGGRGARRRMFADLADQPVLVIGTHFAAPTAGHVMRDGDAFRFEVKASSVPAQTPGAMVPRP